MEVDVLVEVDHVEVVDTSGMTAWDVGMAHLLANDAAVFTLNESVVIGAPGAGFGLFNEEIVEKFSDASVDEFRSVVGMKAQDHEGEACQEIFQQRLQEGIGNALNSANDFPLSNLVNDIDVVDALGFVAVALVDGIHAQIPWLSIGKRFLSCADAAIDRLCLGKDQRVSVVGLGIAQIVEMRHGNVLKSDEAPILEDVDRALKIPSLPPITQRP